MNGADAGGGPRRRHPAAVTGTTAGAGRAARGPEPGTVRVWVLGARPRTLAAAAVPVVVGTAVAHGSHQPVLWGRAVAALVVALAIQIGTNYANDYSDGVRGTDRARAGPVRLVASSLASPSTVRSAALVCFAAAGVAGLALAAVTSWWLVPVGAACFAAGWLYTGGPRPYGYLGLGELFVFAFFGVVATAGSAYVQTGRLSLVALAASLPVGLLATALLEANNLRDIAGDAVAAKRTLAVRLGRRRAGALYVGSLVGAAAGVGWVAWWHPYALVALAAAPLAVRPARSALGDAEGRELLPMLGATGRLQLAAGLLLAVGVLL
ncbi:MAG: 1,4-dihydroxy-2-naphthoate polyprenyltransferase [Acidimicrobiales bacterium]